MALHIGNIPVEAKAIENAKLTGESLVVPCSGVRRVLCFC